MKCCFQIVSLLVCGVAGTVLVARDIILPMSPDVLSADVGIIVGACCLFAQIAKSDRENQVQTVRSFLLAVSMSTGLGIATYAALMLTLRELEPERLYFLRVIPLGVLGIYLWATRRVSAKTSQERTNTSTGSTNRVLTKNVPMLNQTQAHAKFGTRSHDRSNGRFSLAS